MTDNFSKRVVATLKDLRNSINTVDSSKASLLSPIFTGIPLAPTAVVDTNTTQIATTEFVINQGYAKLASPILTGIPVAPTAAIDTNTTQIATTAFVIGQGYAKLNSPTFTGTVVLPSSTSIGNVSSTEIGYLDGVTSAIQTQIDDKEKTIPLQNTAPVSPSASDLWVDNTNAAQPVLKIYNGTSWVTVGSSVVADDDQIILASRVFS